jgi:hypothetical protein
MPPVLEDHHTRHLAHRCSLMPAIQLYVQQRQREIEVRTTVSLHDRYIIIDRANCYQSGASFKDGAKSSSTVISQITDAFEAVKKT